MTPSSNFLGESSRGSDENIPRQTGCDVCGRGRGRILPWKKTEGKEEGREKKKEKTRLQRPSPLWGRRGVAGGGAGSKFVAYV